MKISIDLFEDDLLLLAKLYFNNNSKKTVNTILEASFNNNNTLIFNNKLISVPELKSHSQSCIKWEFEKHLGLNSSIKPEFRTNFYLLSSDIQRTLIELLEKIKDNYGYFYGTVLNLSGYTRPVDGRGFLDFYINISNAVGKSSVHDFLGTLHNYSAKLKCQNSKLPNTTVFISRWEHLKNRFSQPISGCLYSRMLQILGYPDDTDCFEADLNDLMSILQNI